MIDRETEVSLVIAAQAGDEKAANDLIEAHMPLIRSIARRQGRYLDEDDGIANGILGFLEGLPRYEVESGFRVNTFLRHYIAEAIRSANNNAPIVRLPRNRDTAGGMRAIADMLRKGEAVTPETLSAKAGYANDTAKDIIAKHAHSQSGTYRSINDALHIVDRRPHPDEAIEMAQRRELLNKAKDALNERELFIFESRTAAVDKVLTLEELSNVYGVSRERIRQIEMKAIDKVERRLMTLGLRQVDLKAA